MYVCYNTYVNKYFIFYKEESVMYAQYLNNLREAISKLRRKIDAMDDERELFLSLKQEGIKRIRIMDVSDLEKNISEKEQLIDLAQITEKELETLSIQISNLDDEIDRVALYPRSSSQIQELTEKQMNLDFQFTQKYNQLMEQF